MTVTINNTTHPGIKSRTDLLALLQPIHQHHAEIWLDVANNAEEDRPAITLLKNGALCWLMYLRYWGDSGFSTYQTQCAEHTAAVQFSLTNGDSYTTSTANCLDLETGVEVLVYFLETNGERADWVNWRND